MNVHDEIDALNRRARIVANRHALELLELELGIKHRRKTARQ